MENYEFIENLDDFIDSIEDETKVKFTPIGDGITIEEALYDDCDSVCNLYGNYIIKASSLKESAYVTYEEDTLESDEDTENHLDKNISITFDSDLRFIGNLVLIIDTTNIHLNFVSSDREPFVTGELEIYSESDFLGWVSFISGKFNEVTIYSKSENLGINIDQNAHIEILFLMYLEYTGDIFIEGTVNKFFVGIGFIASLHLSGTCNNVQLGVPVKHYGTNSRYYSQFDQIEDLKLTIGELCLWGASYDFFSIVKTHSITTSIKDLNISNGKYQKTVLDGDSVSHMEKIEIDGGEFGQFTIKDIPLVHLSLTNCSFSQFECYNSDMVENIYTISKISLGNIFNGSLVFSSFILKELEFVGSLYNVNSRFENINLDLVYDPDIYTRFHISTEFTLHAALQSHLGKASFLNCNFSDRQIGVNNHAGFEQITSSGTTWPSVSHFYAQGAYEKSLLMRILRTQFQNSHDTINALRFYKEEMHLLKLAIREKKGYSIPIEDKILIRFSGKVSNYGTSRTRALIVHLIITLCLYILFSLSLFFFNNPFPNYSYLISSDYIALIAHHFFLYLLNPFADIQAFSLLLWNHNASVSISIPILVLFYSYKIRFSLFLYQIYLAVRKFERKR